MKIVWNCLKLMTVFAFSIYFIFQISNAKKVVDTIDMVRMYSSICADMSIHAFQDEANMDLYTDFGTSSMSSEYRDYLTWLGNYNEYSEIVSMLHSMFPDGVTAGNFALPYIDETKLNVIFKSNLKTQLDAFNDADSVTKMGGLFGIENLRTKPKTVVLEMRDFSTYGKMFGNNSTFKDNKTGQPMLYDYNFYPSYYIELEVKFDVVFNTSLFGYTPEPLEKTVLVRKTYELFN